MKWQFWTTGFQGYRKIRWSGCQKHIIQTARKEGRQEKTMSQKSRAKGGEKNEWTRAVHTPWLWVRKKSLSAF